MGSSPEGRAATDAINRAARISRRLQGGVAVALAMLAMTFACMPAKAKALEQALADAHLVNAVLNTQRARWRAIDEQVAFAKSGLRQTSAPAATPST